MLSVRIFSSISVKIVFRFINGNFFRLDEVDVLDKVDVRLSPVLPPVQISITSMSFDDRSSLIGSNWKCSFFFETGVILWIDEGVRGVFKMNAESGTALTS